MSNRGQKATSSKSALRTIAEDIFGLFIGLMVVAVFLISSLLGFGMFPSVLVAGFIVYGFSSSLLLFYLFAATLAASALLLGFIPILGQGLYWFVVKDWILLIFQEELEPNRLITLVVWGGLATSLWKSLFVVLSSPAFTSAVSWFSKQYSKSNQQNSAKRGKPQKNSIKREKPRQNSTEQDLSKQSFVRASEEFCLQHLPSIFTHWNKSELQSLRFNYEELSEHSPDFELLKKSAERFERTIDSLELYRNKLGRIRFEKERPRMDLIRRDAPQFILSKEKYTTRLIYEIAFEQEVRSAFISRSVRIEAVMIGQRNDIRLLCLSLGEAAL